ncbi:MAG: hypothetical protein K6F39_03695 [Lachnospiraceae bacterium]|nr:hypothetical protein [Lachnospiraceae bacterium]
MKNRKFLCAAVVMAIMLAGCSSEKENVEKETVSVEETDAVESSVEDTEEADIAEDDAEESSVAEENFEGSEDESEVSTESEEASSEESSEASQEINKDNGEAENGDSADQDSKDFFSSLEGTYEYSGCTLDGKDGELVIKEDESSDDITIDDYIDGDESYYRFLAYSSNCDKVENGRAYLKYPESVYDNGEAVFTYYIFEKTGSGINVYFSNFSFDDAELIYTAE